MRGRMRRSIGFRFFEERAFISRRSASCRRELKVTQKWKSWRECETERTVSAREYVRTVTFKSFPRGSSLTIAPLTSSMPANQPRTNSQRQARGETVKRKKDSNYLLAYFKSNPIGGGLSVEKIVLNADGSNITINPDQHKIKKTEPNVAFVYWAIS